MSDRSAMQVTKAEREVIELLRSGDPFGLNVMLKDGDWLAGTASAPFDGTRASVGMGKTFEEAWRSRQAFCNGTKLDA